MPAQAKVVVDAAEARVATIPRSLSDEYRQKLGELIELTDPQKARLKAWLKNRIGEWKEDTAPLHERLEADNDLVEGVVMETDFPFEDASNVHVPVSEMYMEVFKSVEKRSILGADILWYGETDVDELKDLLDQVEQLMNYKARHEWNIESCLSQVFWTTNRDGLGIIQCTWAEEYESARDIILLTSEEDLFAEFPSPEDAGLDEQEYMDLWKYVVENASPDMPVEVPITFEKLVYHGCKGEVVELIDFVTFPATVPSIKHESCRGYGKRFYMRKGSIRKKRDDGVYYDDAADKLLTKQGNVSRNQYTQSKDDVEGLKRSNKDDFEAYELAIRGRLDGDDDESGERWFLVTYSFEHDELLQVMEYPYRVPFYALFRINERPGRLIGRSIPQKTRDINDEIDTEHNQRINSRTISAVPSFKAQLNAKKELDPMLNNNKWKPGGIFWLTDFNTFEQFKVQPVDQGESMEEEANNFKILDLFLGSAVSLLSGGTATGDPNAPGNKTAIMIQQSNLRMDDPLSELREGVSELGDICLSHLYQFGPPILEYQSAIESGGSAQSQPETKTLHKKFLRRGIHLNMRGVTVTQNPDAEMQKKFQLYQMLMTNPDFAQNRKAQNELLRDALRAGREAGRDRYLPTPQEIQAAQVQIQQQAMQQMELQKAQQAQQAAQQAAQANLGAAKQSLDQKSIAEKIAERALAVHPVDPTAIQENAAPDAAGAPGAPVQ